MDQLTDDRRDRVLVVYAEDWICEDPGHLKSMVNSKIRQRCGKRVNLILADANTRLSFRSDRCAYVDVICTVNLRGIMETDDLRLSFTTALVLDARVVHYTVSKTSPMFGDEAFYKILHSVCVDEYNLDSDTTGVDVKITV